jgi:hypothetical protein
MERQFIIHIYGDFSDILNCIIMIIDIWIDLGGGVGVMRVVQPSGGLLVFCEPLNVRQSAC